MQDSPRHIPESAPPSTPRFPLKRVILTGFMGAGKSTVGALLAQKTGWEFLDLDLHIEKTNGASAREIFAALGESGFRQLESETLAAALRRPNVVVAPGGAVIDKLENQLALAGNKEGLIVFLDAPFETLIERCKEQERAGSATYRPLLHQTEIASARYAMRRVLYSRHAQLTVDVAEKRPDDVAGMILDAMQSCSQLGRLRPPFVQDC